MEGPDSALGLRELLTTPAPLLFQGRSRGLALSVEATIDSMLEEGDFERVELYRLDDTLEIHTADLRATVGVGVPLRDIEAAAGKEQFRFLELPLLDPEATLYDLAVAGVLSRFQPAGGRPAGQVTGLWTPTPDSEKPLLIGCRTAKGVAGYNLARTALLCRPVLPVMRCEILLKPRRGEASCHLAAFPDYRRALDYARDKNGPLWRVPGLTAVELLTDADGAALALSRAGKRPAEAARRLEDIGFSPLQPVAWHERKRRLRERLAGCRVATSVAPPPDAGLVYGDPLAGPWVYAAEEEPPRTAPNPVLAELWPAARLIPTTTVV